MPAKTLALLLALALCLPLCPPALAAPFSDADSALDAAQELLHWAYGLTPATLSLFRCEVEDSGDGTWFITYTGELPYPELLGDYFVALYPNDLPDVRWSYDDAYLSLFPGNIKAPIWGQSELDKAYDAIVHHLPVLEPLVWRQIGAAEAKYAHLVVEWTRDLDGAPLKRYDFLRAAPTPEDLTPGAADALAREAFLDTYGFDAEALSAYESKMDFVTMEDGSQPRYLCRYIRGNIEELSAWIASPSGEVLHCFWAVEVSDRTLPEGPLGGYRTAVSEFLEAGSLYYRNAEEKADLTRRIHEAGFSDLLGAGPVYDTPGAADLPLEEALPLARQALADAYGFTPECFPLFDIYTSLTAEPDRRFWTLDFEPIQWLHIVGVAQRTGGYQVRLDASYGEILDASWSLHGYDPGLAYTERTWGFDSAANSYALPAWTLPWAAALWRQFSSIADAYPPHAYFYGGFSPADAVRADTMMREAGFLRTLYFRAAPRPGDISESLAIFLAKRLLASELALSPELIAGAEVYVRYSVGEITGPQWQCLFYLTDGELEARYHVILDPATGDILDGHCWTMGEG